MREDRRLKGDSSLDDIIKYLDLFGVGFKNVDAEMLFKAELQHLRYYPVADFELLCARCLDFTEIKQQERPSIVEDDGRRVNRIKPVGVPLWQKGLGNMLNWSDYRRSSRSKK